MIIKQRVPAVRLMMVTVFIFSQFIAMATAQEQKIQARGYGTIYQSDKSTARDRAIEDAQRKAVEQALGTMISSESITENYQLIHERILSLSNGYIEKYQVISETQTGDELEVEISALVGIRKLDDSLQAVKNLIRRMNKPRLMVLIAEQSILEEGKKDHAKLSATNLGISENVLITAFKEKGFHFVDRQALAGKIEVADPMTLVNDHERVKTLANLTDAQLAIIGQAQARTSGKVHGIYSGQANISLRVLKPDTGEILVATHSHAAVPFVDPSTANTKALTQAAEKISQALMEKILRKWRSETGGIRNITLIVKNISYSRLKTFRGWLPKYIRGIRTVNQRNLIDGTAELDVEVIGSAQNLADELSEKKFLDKTIEVQKLLSNKVGIELK